MKVAALILAHKNKVQLDRLISALQHPNIDIYIHLDKKSALSSQDFQWDNVYFTEKRFDVRLFEFSMVDAEMELIKTALERGKYSYFIMLSGQCYPLRHIDNIYDYLCRVYPKPMIEVISTEIVRMFAHQFRYSYAMKRFKTTSESFLKRCLNGRSIYPYKYIPAGIVFVATQIKSLFIKSPKRRLEAMGITPYFGSQWWLLPDLVIDELLLAYQNEEFCNCIRDCCSCDETFFQTAIMVHADRYGISLEEEGYYRGYYPQKKWFAIFSHNHPICITQDNYEQLVNSSKLFARKFDIEVDSAILDMLDQRSLALRDEKIPD